LPDGGSAFITTAFQEAGTMQPEFTQQPESTYQEAVSTEFITTQESTSQQHHPSKSSQQDPNREAFWRATIQQQRQSGLTIREFCRQRKLSESAWHRWKSKFARRDEQPVNETPKKKTISQQNNHSVPTFIPVALDPAAMRPPQINQPQVEQPQVEQPQVEILYAGGTTVRIASGCDEQTVVTILQVLGNSTC